MIISIKDFLKTARFGGIKIGASKACIIRAFGMPDSDNNMAENGCILLYGWYEFFINNEDHLYAIQNDHYDPTTPETFQFKSDEITIDPWILTSMENLDISSLVERLAQEKIEAKTTGYFGREVIETKTGIVIDFDEEIAHPGTRNLLGFRYWPK